MDILTQSPATLALLAANIIASVVGFARPDFQIGNSFWIRPIREGGQWHRIVTSGFLHVDPFHLLINMYVLFGFGPALEHYFGMTGFLLIYFGSLVGGSLWMYFQKRNDPDYKAVGASGAISGLMLAICVIAPFSMLWILGIVPVWAIVFGVLYIALSYVLSHRENAVIAHGGHLGGAVAGLVITLLLDPEALGDLLQQVAARLG